MSSEFQHGFEFHGSNQMLELSILLHFHARRHTIFRSGVHLPFISSILPLTMTLRSISLPLPGPSPPYLLDKTTFKFFLCSEDEAGVMPTILDLHSLSIEARVLTATSLGMISPSSSPWTFHSSSITSYNRGKKSLLTGMTGHEQAEIAAS